jgi:hypothetical protein
MVLQIMLMKDFLFIELPIHNKLGLNEPDKMLSNRIRSNNNNLLGGRYKPKKRNHIIFKRRKRWKRIFY